MFISFYLDCRRISRQVPVSIAKSVGVVFVNVTEYILAVFDQKISNVKMNFPKNISIALFEDWSDNSGSKVAYYGVFRIYSIPESARNLNSSNMI